MLDKKTLPIIVLLIIVILFYYPILDFLGLYTPPVPSPKTEVQVADTVSNQTTSQAIDIANEPEQTASAPVKLTEIPAVSDTLPIDTIQITTEKYVALLSTRGGGLVSLKLREHTYRDGREIEMLNDCKDATPNVRFAAGSFSVAQLSFVPSLKPGSYDATRDTVEISFTHTSAQGGVITRTYRFFPDTYHFMNKLRVDNREAFGFERKYTMMWNTPLGVTEPQAKQDYAAMQAVAMQSGTRESLDDYENNTLKETLDGATSWAGVRTKYFAAVIIPSDRDGENAIARGEKKEISTSEGKIEAKYITAGMEMSFASVPTFIDSFTVFVGPMDYLLMQEYNVGLEDMLDIGTMPFVGWILKPFAIGIMWLLPKIYTVIPNYGLVIILFAIMVKLVTLPLSMKQFKSMQGMKDLAPKIEELKQKYKKDPQALQRETMKVYKAHGVNPMSGCLIMLPQMPLMIAMFRVFQATILLRGAPFVGFVDDLSRGATLGADPYLILVVLMILTQLLSSHLTMGGNQQNKAMTYMFPLMLGFFLYNLPSGLILYWTIFSLLSLLDWFLFKRNKTDQNPQVKTA